MFFQNNFWPKYFDIFLSCEKDSFKLKLCVVKVQKYTLSIKKLLWIIIVSIIKMYFEVSINNLEYHSKKTIGNCP